MNWILLAILLMVCIGLKLLHNFFQDLTALFFIFLYYFLQLLFVFVIFILLNCILEYASSLLVQKIFDHNAYILFFGLAKQS